MHTSCGVGGACGRYESVPLCGEATVFSCYSAAMKPLLTRYSGAIQALFRRY
jgi:hypothetical protein